MIRNILLIEDNEELSRLVAMHLKDLAYQVEAVFDGTEGFVKIKQQPYDLIILDLMLPGMDGLEICRHIRALENYTPILMLTSKSSELDRVVGLEVGADDYVTKPFSIRELMARVKALFRRIDELKTDRVPSPSSSIQAGYLEIDPKKRVVKVENAPVDLTAKEFDLLWHFAQHPGRVFTRSQLLDTVWGYGHDGYEHTVNSHINRLRAKIEKDHTHPECILTVWGVGYKFAEDT